MLLTGRVVIPDAELETLNLNSCCVPEEIARYRLARQITTHILATLVLHPCPTPAGELSYECLFEFNQFDPITRKPLNVKST